MKIRLMEEYRQAIKKLDDRITSNSAFPFCFEYMVEDLLRQGHSLDLEVNEDDARLLVAPTYHEVPGRRSTSMTAYDISLTKSGGIEVIKSIGEAINPDDYYANPNTGKRPDKPIKSVLNVEYYRSEFDKDGIEINKSEYYNIGIPREEDCFNNGEELAKLLLSEGRFRPYYGYGKQKFPIESEEARLVEYTRMPNNPALVYISNIVRTKSNAVNDYREEKYFLGMNDTSWPENIRVPDCNCFARKKSFTSDWELVESSIRCSYKTIPENEKHALEVFMNELEYSQTKRSNLKEYEVLYDRCQKALEWINKPLEYEIVDNPKPLDMLDTPHGYSKTR